jgi:outer membrane protein W
MLVNQKLKNKNNATPLGNPTFTGGFGGELAFDYFFTDHIAIEAAGGYNMTHIKTQNVTTNTSNKNHFVIIPITGTVQWYLIPSALISPYVGAGYSYQVVSGGPSGYSAKSGSGAVGQIGADIQFNDMFAFNVDVKYTYKASHDLTYNNVKHKNSLSTISTLVGVAFPF